MRSTKSTPRCAASRPSRSTHWSACGPRSSETMIAGVSVEITREAVLVLAAQPFRVLSSAVHLGGFAEARAILNVHVPKGDPCLDPSRTIVEFARHARVPGPWVGLLTGAATERAVIAEEAIEGSAALAVATVGLSN